MSSFFDESYNSRPELREGYKSTELYKHMADRTNIRLIVGSAHDYRGGCTH